MAVTIKTGTPVYSLTSPPEQPEPQPPDDLIAEAVSYADRKILVTIPFPDTLELTLDVLPEHITFPIAKGGPTQMAKQIDEALSKLLEIWQKGETLAAPKPKVSLGTKRKATFNLQYDPDQPLHRAQLVLARQPKPDFGSWSVKLDFSVSKAGPSGLVKLIALIEEALPLSFAAMLPDFRVYRIDPAIDLIGANPLDLIAHINKPGKRLVYVGTKGHPETVYLFEEKAPLKKPPKTLAQKTTGPMRLKMYERRDYTRQLLLPPPYGPCPVTRIETELRWKNKPQRPKLTTLANLKKNPFVGHRVGYAAKLANELSQPKNWLSFCLAAFGGGVATAQKKWQISAGLKAGELYRSCPGDLVNESRWSKWQAGLDYTGLSAWITAAKNSK